MSYSIILYTVLVLSILGVLSAIILYFVAEKFKVYEDPRVLEIESLLPSGNCGACGFAGCKNFAEAFVKAEDINQLHCPVVSADALAEMAKVVGKEAVLHDPMIAVVRCSGSPEHRAKTVNYNGASSCKLATTLANGDTGCQYGCLGLGDCVAACTFDAIFMDEETGLPYVDEDKCTACGDCVKACPKSIIELRKKGPKGKRIFVSCVSKEKGGLAKKACEVACIGCGKCVKACPFDAITLENFLAYIDFEKCKLCRKCVDVCPTGSILEINFPPKKVKAEPQNEVEIA